MAARDDIHRLIREDKISAEEGASLIEAFETAEARDRAIHQEIKHARTAQRSSRGWAAAGAGLLLFGLGWLVASLIAAPSTSSPVSIPEVQGMPQLPGTDLTAVIETLEQRLRQPGHAADYRLLGTAYSTRYQQTGVQADRERATQAFARAERLERRTAMRGNLGGSGVFGIVFVLVILTAVGIWVMMLYNGLAKRDERVNERWAQVETVLQRRLDLVPQLVETVKGYAKHEQQTLLAVTEARAKVLGILQATATAAPKSGQTVRELNQAQQDLSSALKKVFALAEQYPDLKASGNFLTLQDQLEGTENRIAVERQRYNDAVRNYNAGLRVFPGNVVGSLFGFQAHEYFESKLGAEDPTAVRF